MEVEESHTNTISSASANIEATVDVELNPTFVEASSPVDMSPYQRYIALSRYARYLPDKLRRETWEETVARYCNYMARRHASFPTQRAYDAIVNLQVMPSMRALMTAGKALDRDNIAGYNCAFVALDDARAFDESLYVLMCGCGLGFSVERQHISKLPDVADEFHNSTTSIKVEDSRIGWAKAFRELISLLYVGHVPNWDLSQLRAKGVPLKTFGGRSSGPGPLNDLFMFVTRIFKNAAGRKLTSVECHDIMCKIGDIVVSGGVRRCLSFDTLVQTDIDTWKQIDQITTDDKIYLDGDYFNVSNVFDQGEQEVLQINLGNGKYLESTPTHKWLVFDHTTNDYAWIEAQFLNENHSMIDPNND